MRRGELDACDDQDEWGAEAEARERTESELAETVARLDRAETHDACGEEEEAEEQGFADRAEACARVAPDQGGQEASDPVGLGPRHSYEGVGCEQRGRPEKERRLVTMLGDGGNAFRASSITSSPSSTANRLEALMGRGWECARESEGLGGKRRARAKGVDLHDWEKDNV